MGWLWISGYHFEGNETGLCPEPGTTEVAIFGSFWPVHNSRAMSPRTTPQCRPRRHCNVAQDDTNRNIIATEIPNRKEDGSESGLDCALLRTFQSEKLLDRRKNAPARDLGRLNADGWQIEGFALCHLLMGRVRLVGQVGLFYL